ncbi:hypothetical protein DQ04_03131030 [Trypanosoma grayi]|uniref:hypothetical protein n=1 Tax=Trypanosoma grayi TaxID=71804 RepID=UPI0004F4346F|nr:hypothetical protein DQ04_03131030 [Trypanosoma grayi]KEG10942.1 hypothetical protein DQ04_03131030 [Trypanosoma grayi]
MSLESDKAFLHIVGHANHLKDIKEVTLILQGRFVELFRADELPSPSFRRGAASLASREEEKVLAVRAVCTLHSVGRERHKAYFESDEYHPSAAFFLQEMLGALAGDKQHWFQTLQLESLSACVAVVEAIGWKNTRCCLPGIILACVKYLLRAPKGTDAVAVSTGAIELLRLALVVSLGVQGGEGDWLRETVGHLGRSMDKLLNPGELTRDGFPLSVVQALQLLTTDVLLLPALGAFLSSPFVQLLLVANFILKNITFILSGDADVDSDGIPSSFLQQAAVVKVLQTQLAQLRGVQLLHYASALLRCNDTRAVVLGNESYISRVLSQCVQVAGAVMEPEELYSVKATRSYASRVVDACIECAAIAVAHWDEGPQMMAKIMDTAAGVLADWDAYMLHPPTIYVVTRFFLWQYTTSAWATEKGTPVEEVMLSGVFERLWSVVAQPHLWNICEDEKLCSHQQLQHRHTVAATILRFLELTAQVLRDGVAGHKVKHKRAVQRLNVLVLYLVLEKATCPGIVHDAALRALDAFSAAGRYKDVVTFFLDQVNFIIDEATRAVTEDTLRSSALRVLMSSTSFIQKKLMPGLRNADFGTLAPLKTVEIARSCGFASTTVLSSAIAAGAVPKVADFLVSTIKIAGDACRRAVLEEEKADALASLMLLAQCFIVGAALNRSVPQLGIDDERDVMTTAAEPRVQLLQLNVLGMVHLLLGHCARHDAVAPFAIRAMTSGLTVLLTTSAAAEWQREEEHGDEAISSPPSSPPSFVWDDNAAAVLPRSHLRTVYQTYLVFMAILTEPVAAFVTTGTSQRRSAQRRRALESVRPTPAVPDVLGGLAALYALTPEFLAPRMVGEVIPVVAVWHERGMLPRIPTGTDEKLRSAVKEFLQRLCATNPTADEELRAAASSILQDTCAMNPLVSG